jgi:hypothetical protein
MRIIRYQLHLSSLKGREKDEQIIGLKVVICRPVPSVHKKKQRLLLLGGHFQMFEHRAHRETLRHFQFSIVG